MLSIRLFPKGKKHQRTFRIVVAEKRAKLNGNVVENLGFFVPQTKKLKLDSAKLTSWQKRGAKISPGVNKLLSLQKSA